jgi:hypothetical protein
MAMHYLNRESTTTTTRHVIYNQRRLLRSDAHADNHGTTNVKVRCLYDYEKQRQAPSEGRNLLKRVKLLNVKCSPFPRLPPRTNIRQGIMACL